MIGGVNVVSPNGDAWSDASEFGEHGVFYENTGMGEGRITLRLIFPWLMGESDI